MVRSLPGKIRDIFFYLILPVGYALIMRYLFGQETDGLGFFNVMTLSFMLGLPFVTGVLVVLLSKKEDASRLRFRITAPWTTIGVFWLLTSLLNLEGWACWVMAAPLFLGASTLGGLLGGALNSLHAGNGFKVSLLAPFLLLPILLSPIEHAFPPQARTYVVHSSIDIDAPVERVWDELLAVSPIQQKESKGYLGRFLGLPQPVKASFAGRGVGAKREAHFKKGLIFHETITQYKELELLAFDIEVNPAEIPTGTLDEHVMIGGRYFDVLDGKYEIEKLANGHIRLHLTSSFRMQTTFNFYTATWGNWIIEDFQRNILHVEKVRAEQSRY